MMKQITAKLCIRNLIISIILYIAVGVYIFLIYTEMAEYSSMYPIFSVLIFTAFFINTKVLSYIFVRNATVKILSDAFEIYFKENNIEYEIDYLNQKKLELPMWRKFVVDGIEVIIKTEAGGNSSIAGIKIYPFYKIPKVFKWCKEATKETNKLLYDDKYKNHLELITILNKEKWTDIMLALSPITLFIITMVLLLLIK